MNHNRITILFVSMLIVVFGVLGGLFIWQDKVQQVDADNYNVQVGENDACAMTIISTSEPKLCNQNFDVLPSFGASCKKQLDDAWHCTYTCYILNFNVSVNVYNKTIMNNFNILYPTDLYNIKFNDNKTTIKCYYDLNPGQWYLTIYQSLEYTTTPLYMILSILSIFCIMFFVFSVGFLMIYLIFTLC